MKKRYKKTNIFINDDTITIYIIKTTDMKHSFKIKFTSIIKEIPNIFLNKNQIDQLLEYLWIYKSNNYDQHWEVNNHISRYNLWDDFTEIRSLNDHGYEKNIKGITPKYYFITCRAMSIEKGDGASLISSEVY